MGEHISGSMISGSSMTSGPGARVARALRSLWCIARPRVPCSFAPEILKYMRGLQVPARGKCEAPHRTLRPRGGPCAAAGWYSDLGVMMGKPVGSFKSPQDMQHQEEEGCDGGSAGATPDQPGTLIREA